MGSVASECPVISFDMRVASGSASRFKTNRHRFPEASCGVHGQRQNGRELGNIAVVLGAGKVSKLWFESARCQSAATPLAGPSRIAD
jgi:hypothetical protein